MSADHTLNLLGTYESRNVTFVTTDGSWPIVWESAKGQRVWDVSGRVYLDLTAAFGVAAAGHANLRVVRAGQRQMGRLLHAMGDVHPHPLKAQLARELSRITFERWARARYLPPPTHRKRWPPVPAATGKTIFCNSGFEAVEAALKTALLATGKPGVIAFEGAYHGLGYGALTATSRGHFRSPFQPQLAGFVQFIPFPERASELKGLIAQIRALLEGGGIGTVLAEPIQGRGGIRVPPAGFLAALRECCDGRETLLVLDEVYTGFGRTGHWFACEHDRVAPDIICLGKALTGGFPLSACVGRAELMDAAWPAATGEAIHTSTFLGHPVGCAMALAQIAEIRRLQLPFRSARLGRRLLAALRRLPAPDGLRLEARGQGLMAGIELCRSDGSPAGDRAFDVVRALLRRGFIVIPEGEFGNVISFTPPLTITERQLDRAVKNLDGVLRQQV